MFSTVKAMIYQYVWRFNSDEPIDQSDVRFIRNWRNYEPPQF